MSTGDRGTGDTGRGFLDERPLSRVRGCRNEKDKSHSERSQKDQDAGRGMMKDGGLG